MRLHEIVTALDAEIERLQEARRVLAELVAPARTVRRTLSSTSRRRIAEAQQRRWAKPGKQSDARSVVEITVLPPKGEPRRRLRAASSPALPTALSRSAEIVAVPAAVQAAS